MNYQGYAINKQHEHDIPTNQSTVTLYLSHKTEEIKLGEDIKTFKKVEHYEAPTQRIKKRRAYELPLL